MTALVLKSKNTPAILRCPPEIFPLVASHLPLQHLPASLSALALTAREVYFYINPILYKKVIVKRRGDASRFLRRISMDPAKLGPLVRELHIRVDITEEKDTNVFVKLQGAIKKGSLPRMKYIRLALLKSWSREDSARPGLISQYRLPRKFWAVLQTGCPLLRGICVDGVGDSRKDFHDLKDLLGLTAVTLKYDFIFPSKELSEKLCQLIINLASSLQSLTIQNGLEDASSLFSTTFPYLKYISLYYFHFHDQKINDAMDFWKRHPNLERVNIYPRQGCRLFSDSIGAKFLPKLTALRAGFADVRALASHLDQLEHLSIAYSYNMQIPYLLRSVLPDGLPNLRSLEINQRPCMERFIRTTEGAMWYETEDGDFLQKSTLQSAQKSIDSSYIQAVVSRAPNLVELCIHSSTILTPKLKAVSPILGKLKFLERFYYRAFPSRMETDVEPAALKDFLLRCRLLGDDCDLLRTVTDVSFYTSGPYLTGNIIRGHDGPVEDVIPGRGFGMELSGEDNDPFPLNLMSGTRPVRRH